MRTRSARYLAGFAAAAALAVPLAAASQAQASVRPAVIRTAPGTDATLAGYTSGAGRWIRFANIVFNAPTNAQCIQEASAETGPASVPAGFGAAITLGPADEATTGVPSSQGDAAALGVSAVPSAAGCGLISPAFNTNLSGTATLAALSPITISPGDLLRAQLYYRQADQQTIATLYDLTTGKTATGHVAGSALYVGASASFGSGPVLTQPAQDFRAFQFTSGAVTTYTAHRGNLATFGDSQVDMRQGAPAAVVASPSALWGGGTSFGVWVRSAAS
jgi:hypothetical protein